MVEPLPQKLTSHLLLGFIMHHANLPWIQATPQLVRQIQARVQLRENLLDVATRDNTAEPEQYIFVEHTPVRPQFRLFELQPFDVVTKDELREILNISKGYCKRVLSISQSQMNQFNACTPQQKTQLLVLFMEMCYYDDVKKDPLFEQLRPNERVDQHPHIWRVPITAADAFLCIRSEWYDAYAIPRRNPSPSAMQQKRNMSQARTKYN